METYVREIELDLSKERHDEVYEIAGNTIVNLTPEYEIYIKLDDPTNQPINISYIQKLTNASFSRLYITNSKQEGTAKLLVGANFDVDLIPRYIDEINTVLTDGFTRIVTKTGIDQMQDGEVLYTMIQQTASEVSMIGTKLNYTPDDPENWSQQYAAISATYDKVMSVVNTLNKADVEAEEQFSVIKQLANKIRFETVKITSTKQQEVYLELDNEGKIVLSADRVVIDGNAIVTGAIDGNLIRAHTIKADHIESSLWGDLNQAMLYVKTMMSGEGEANIVPSYAELVAGTYEGFYVTSDAKLKLYTQKYWDDGVTYWDDGSTWDIPTVSYAYWESLVYDLGQELSGQVNVTFFYDTDSIDNFTINVYFSYFDTNTTTWSDWLVCKELRTASNYKVFIGNIQTYQKFKIKIEVIASNTNYPLELYNMLISINLINTPGHDYMNIPINDDQLNLHLNADMLDGKHASDFVQQDAAGNVAITGALDVAGDTTVKGINVLKVFPPAIPEGSTAYFKKQLIDEIIGIKPDGYDGSSITNYGLRTSSDGTTLVVTERKDDVPFPGVTSFAVEEGTTNLFTNPIFQNGETGFDFILAWSSRTIKDGGPLGRYIELVDSTSSGGSYGATFNVTPGQTYTFSVYINVLECQGGSVSLYYHWLDANGIIISVSTSGTLGEEVPSDFVGQGWRRYKITDTAPANAAKVRAFVYSSEAASSRIQVTGFQFEQKPFPTSFVDGTRADGIVKLTNPPLPLDNFVVNLWFKPTRYPTQTGYAWHLFDVSYNASAFQGLELSAPPSAQEGIPSNTLSLTVRHSSSTFTGFNLGFDLSAEIGKWHMITLISNGNTVDVYIDGEKRVSVTNDIQRSVIEFIVFGRWFANISGTGMENGFLMSNVLFASYEPTIWTDSYIRFLYETQKPFYVC